MKHILLTTILTIVITPLFAQSKGDDFTANTPNEPTTTQRGKNKYILNNLDLSITAGSTGVGLEITAPITKYAHLRTGFDVMPTFERKINFGVRVGEKEPGQTDAEYADASKKKFNELSSKLTSLTGQKVEDNIDVIGQPTFHNFKLLFDVYPFVKSRKESLRNLYVTAGFYWGNSHIARAYNTTEDMPTLMSVSIYNNMYEKFSGDDYLDYFIDNPIYGNIYLDPELAIKLAEKFEHYGRMGFYMGNYTRDMYNSEGEKTHSKGEPYFIEPDEDCMVKAKIKVNNIKPYLGLGYGTDLSKSKSGWGISFDAGALFWGGTPSIITHDGTDIAKDIDHTHGKVGDYIKLIKKFKVYPVVNIKITKRLY